jgi:predicted dehydrogenase
VIERRNAGGSPDLIEEAIDVPNLYVEEITHFSECILHDKEPLLTAQSALANQRVLDAAMRLE